MNMQGYHILCYSLFLVWEGQELQIWLVSAQGALEWGRDHLDAYDKQRRG